MNEQFPNFGLDSPLLF